MSLDDDQTLMAAGIGSGGSSLMLFGYVPGQLVEARTDLGVTSAATGQVEVAVKAGGQGQVWGAATNGARNRLAVLFDDHLGEVLNVDPDEIGVGEVLFDAQSCSIEAHLARLIWEGRDPMVNPPPPPEAFQWRLPASEERKARAAHHPPSASPVRSPAGYASPAGQGSPVSVMDVSPYRGHASVARARLAQYTPRLLAFFERYNPHRLPSVAQLLTDNRGREEELMKSLVAKYGPEPVQHADPSDLPPGWTQVQSSKGHVFYRHVGGDRQWTRPTF